jgi:hypothetical protein
MEFCLIEIILVDKLYMERGKHVLKWFTNNEMVHFTQSSYKFFLNVQMDMVVIL